MTHCGTQTIETDRLILRRFRPEDAAPMYRNWASDPEVTKYMTWPVHPDETVTQSVVADWTADYARETCYHWAITLKGGTDEPIGDISVVKMREDVALAHVGYCLGRQWWGQGLMTEALRAVTQYMFEDVHAQRVEAAHDARNPASGRVMAKCGMRHEGTLRRAGRNNQGVCDLCFYGILAEEYDQH